MNIKQMLAHASRPQRTVAVCLNGAVALEYEELRRRIDKAGKESVPSLAGSATTAREMELTALKERMREHTVTFTVAALGRPEWRALVDAHPPRKLEDGTTHPDDGAGVNEATFYSALVRKSIVDPEMDAADHDLLESTLTDAQYSRLCKAAFDVNRHEIDVPF